MKQAKMSVAVGGLLLMAAVPAHAVPPAFTPPAGVSAYRLLFVTSGTIDGTSGSIGTYNSFVQSQAALSSIGIPTSTWRALISTLSINAVDNIACGSSCDALPIYMVNGTTLVATSSASLFSFTFSSVFDQSNTSVSNAYVWTGSGSNGTAFAGAVLGSSNPESYYLNQGSLPGTDPAARLDHVFAISGQINAATAVPEPESAALLFAGLLAVTFVRRRLR